MMLNCYIYKLVFRKQNKTASDVPPPLVDSHKKCTYTFLYIYM